AAREEQKAQRERDRAREAMARLDAEQPEIAAAKTMLQRARTAETLRAIIAATVRAAQARDAAVAAETSARSDWQAVGVALDDVTAEALDDWASQRTRERGAWELAADLEKDSAALTAEAE